MHTFTRTHARTHARIIFASPAERFLIRRITGTGHHSKVRTLYYNPNGTQSRYYNVYALCIVSIIIIVMW